MADYIRRDDAVKIAEKYGLANGSVLGRHTGLADCIARDISELPTADVAEVVRCKDCKHWQRHTGVVDSPNGHCFAIETCKNGMDFCSYGEYQKNTGGVTHD